MFRLWCLFCSCYFLSSMLVLLLFHGIFGYFYHFFFIVLLLCWHFRVWYLLLIFSSWLFLCFCIFILLWLAGINLWMHIFCWAFCASLFILLLSYIFFVSIYFLCVLMPTARLLTDKYAGKSDFSIRKMRTILIQNKVFLAISKLDNFSDS